MWRDVLLLSGRKLDSLDDMAEWLDVDKLDGEGSDPPDLFVVGFQEVPAAVRSSSHHSHATRSLPRHY